MLNSEAKGRLPRGEELICWASWGDVVVSQDYLDISLKNVFSNAHDFDATGFGSPAHTVSCTVLNERFEYLCSLSLNLELLDLSDDAGLRARMILPNGTDGLFEKATLAWVCAYKRPKTGGTCLAVALIQEDELGLVCDAIENLFEDIGNNSEELSLNVCKSLCMFDPMFQESLLEFASDAIGEDCLESVADGSLVTMRGLLGTWNSEVYMPPPGKLKQVWDFYWMLSNWLKVRDGLERLSKFPLLDEDSETLREVFDICIISRRRGVATKGWENFLKYAFKSYVNIDILEIEDLGLGVACLKCVDALERTHRIFSLDLEAASVEELVRRALHIDKRVSDLTAKVVFVFNGSLTDQDLAEFQKKSLIPIVEEARTSFEDKAVRSGLIKTFDGFFHPVQVARGAKEKLPASRASVKPVENRANYVQAGEDANFRAKILSTVELPRRGSNQHELHGLTRFVELLGHPKEQKVELSARIEIYLPDISEPLIDRQTLRWYDARANSVTRSELRMYYPRAIADRLSAFGQGDFVVLELRPDSKSEYVENVLVFISRRTPRFSFLSERYNLI